ncbi:site-specific integrase [Nocardioides sp. 1609]|uniref:tyrosine-type recombinase/integrase n=1 Tax=Nocardioides sp. 1609 TaxID=2508327 RepID=UPI001432211F|nr:site-specific integrase [Nocardioides sp. 1609]
MATYNVAKIPDGRWRARYRGPDRRERTRIFDRKVDADRWGRAQTARVDRGDWTDPALGRTTVEAYAAEWLRGKVKLRESTRATYDALLRTHVLPTWGSVSLSGVRHEEVAAWVTGLHASGLSASRTRQAWVVLSQVLELAVKARRIPSNPARGVELPSLPSRSTREEIRALDERQVWALADAAGDHRLSVLALAWCGLRFGELAALRVRSFDVLRRELRVAATLSELGGRLVEGPPKTEGSVRTVPVPAWLVDELAPLMGGKGPEDRLFTASEGGPLRLGNWRGRVFDPAVRLSGLATQVRGDLVRPHDLRHTCASLHIKHGTPPKVLSTMLGHASVAITLDRYGHLYPGDAHTYVDRLGEVAVAARAAQMRHGRVEPLRSVPLASVGSGL